MSDKVYKIIYAIVVVAFKCITSYTFFTNWFISYQNNAMSLFQSKELCKKHKNLHYLL